MFRWFGVGAWPSDVAAPDGATVLQGVKLTLRRKFRAGPRIAGGIRLESAALALAPDQLVVVVRKGIVRFTPALADAGGGTVTIADRVELAFDVGRLAFFDGTVDGGPVPGASGTFTMSLRLGSDDLPPAVRDSIAGVRSWHVHGNRRLLAMP